jgi:aminoglycoside phosphotransferase (APT) family kinase protein
VIERIREDLQTKCRELLDRPGLLVTSIETIPEGHSGFTYFVTIDQGAGPRRLVLRLPPPGARIAGPADVVRQGRIMAALHSQGLPAPAVPILTSDPAVDGRPFVLMEAVDGKRIETTGIEQKPLDIAASAVRVLKSLQAVPLEETGIGSEEPVGLQAEMLRWLWLMERAPAELTQRAGDLGGMLAARIPREREPTLVLDWEIAEIGQPLLDLGCLCIVSHRRRYEGAPNPGGSIDVAVEDLYRLYGADAGEMRWYLALSLYKYASIFGYNLMLHRRGKRPDPMYEGLTDTIVGMIDEGIALLEPSA